MNYIKKIYILLSSQKQKVFLFFSIYKRKSHINIILINIFRRFIPVATDEIQLKNAMNWLNNAQRFSKCGGVSGGYSLEKGWLPPYPETTGYIIPTFINYSEYTNNRQYLYNAIEMADWEIKIQLKTGAVRGGMGINNYPIVFNTGQVILGWISIYNKTNDKKYLNAAIKAANWLIQIQDEDGSWKKHTYQNHPHSYNSRVAWALFGVYQHTNNKIYKIAATKKIEWIIQTQYEKNWIKQMSFYQDDTPLTHTLFYTLRGLFESLIYLDQDLKVKTYNIINIFLEEMLRYKHKKFYSAKIDNQWQEVNKNYTCITGNAQAAIMFHKFGELSNNKIFKNEANRIKNNLKTVQIINTKDTNLTGAMPGSFPIWGEYMKYTLPNWGTKFFADLLLLKIHQNNKS